MAVDLDTLNFLAPGLVSVTDADKTKALEFAADFRPQCLTEASQDRAQLYYAIWLLYDRKRQADEGSTGIISAPDGVKSIKEGDVTVVYSDGGAPARVGVLDPSGYYAKWQKLNDMCGVGSITASDWRNHVHRF